MIKYDMRLIDTAEVLRTLQILMAPGNVIELRILNATTRTSRYPYQASGYFDDPQALVESLKPLTSSKGVYITLQPCIPELLARAKNRLRSADEMRLNKSSTSDNHILAYRWLLIDADPERPADISASDREHDAALAHTLSIQNALQQLGWPEPVRADSANGAHLLYPIDLPVTQKNLVQRVLEGLADRFDIEGIHIDQTVFNPSRISKLYGTLACKGDDTSERPHRMSRLLSVPEVFTPVSLEMLEAIARPQVAQKTEPRYQQYSRQEAPPAFDVSQWITSHNLDVQGPKEWEKGTRWVFNVCPWNSDHTDRSAYIVQFKNGAIAAGCQHNSCREKTWHDLRALYQPSRAGNNGNGGTSSVSSSSSASDPLPEIVIGGDQLRDLTNRAIDAILLQERQHPTLFLQSARLVRIARDETKRPIIAQMGVNEVKEALTHSANYFRLKKMAGSDVWEKVPTSPTKELAEQILARQTQKPYLPFPALSAVVETPVIRPDGTILDQPGYDKKTKLYYAPQDGMKVCKVPVTPTQEERDAALALILEALGEFPYVEDADKANALGLCLTPLVRPTIKRHVPLALVDAPKRGSGKGLYSDVVSIIATGNSAAILTLSDSDEELQKTITSLLIEGATIITIDNVSGLLQSKHLDAVLTSDMWRGRILGQSKMTYVPQRATWLATGNNIRIGGDLGRRCYRIRLDPKVSRPWMRSGFKHEDLTTWVIDHRAELISALLTLARAWFVAGCPQYDQIPVLGTFTGWSKTVGSILEYAGVHGFLSNLTKLYDEADEGTAQWEAFFQSWVALLGSEWVPTTVLNEQLGAARGKDEESDAPLAETLPEALQIALKEKPKSFKVSLSKALDKRVDECFGDENLRLEKKRDKHLNINLWRVLRGVAEVLPVPCKEKESDVLCADVNTNTHRDDLENLRHPSQIKDVISHKNAQTGSSSVTRDNLQSIEDSAIPQNASGPLANVTEMEDYYS